MEPGKGQTREEVITKLAGRIDSFERYSQPHSRLMAALAVGLTRRMGFAQADIAAVREAALLHDIGLFAMSPGYCSSPGPLRFDDRVDLWRHPVIGEQQMAKNGATRYAQLLVRWHHERWNGSGYPDSLAFEDIPIGARVLYTVEMYSALISQRPYRNTLTNEEVISKLKASAGVECDPYVVKALLELLEDLCAEEVEPPGEGGGTTATAPEPFNQPHFFEPFLGPAHAEVRTATTVPGEPPETGAASTGEAQASPQESADDAMPKGPLAAISSLPSVEATISKLESAHSDKDEGDVWRGWTGSRYNKKALLGFEASVLRQVQFRSIAIAYSGGARLDWYLRAWGKQILSNDPRAWAAATSKATIEGRGPLTEEQIGLLLEDVYVPGVRLRNPHLRRWFSETDSWWMDNLRHNIETLVDETLQAQALALGLQTGNYALSFREDTQDLRRPLTALFWQLAGRSFGDPDRHPSNRVTNGPAREFISRARADLLYLDLPAAHADQGGSEARSHWRECWVIGKEPEEADDLLRLTAIPQSKQAYLAMVDGLLRAAAHIKIWAIGYQEVGLASAREISDLIKEHRPVTATYSKDLTEVAGGLRNYIIVASGEGQH